MEISTPVRLLPSPATSNFRMVWSMDNGREKLIWVIIRLGQAKVCPHQLISCSALTSNFFFGGPLHKLENVSAGNDKPVVPQWHHWPQWRGRCCQGWRRSRHLSSLCSATHLGGCTRCPGWRCRPLEHMEEDFALSSTCIDPFPFMQTAQLKNKSIFHEQTNGGG